ncbi:MAG: lipopolysaccharide biosynthesis protein, partial [Bacteroidales bacterium]|nr:lipopolysaccharide biosynthesis protein [Bacteroidales bacterium]
MIDAKRIAKNTVFMYIRMGFILIVSLFTSRVVLDKLGTDDYALYNVVYGVIGLLSFLNGTLSIGTSRFITFALGKKDQNLLRTTFSTAFSTHLALALIILVIGETIGLWYANNVMVVPPGRMHAALTVYQISIATTMVAIIQVPFMSSIIAHEDMGAYAVIGIIEAIALLGIVYCLTNSSHDKLILYALLFAGVKLIMFLSYVIHSKTH